MRIDQLFALALEVLPAGTLPIVVAVWVSLVPLLVFLWTRERRRRVSPAPVTHRPRYFSQNPSQGASRITENVALEILETHRSVAARFARGEDLSVEVVTDDRIPSRDSRIEIWGTWTERDGAWTDRLGHIPSSTFDDHVTEPDRDMVSATLVSVTSSNPPVIKVTLWSENRVPLQLVSSG